MKKFFLSAYFSFSHIFSGNFHSKLLNVKNLYIINSLDFRSAEKEG